MINIDVGGEFVGPRREVHTEWAILVDSLVNGEPGPHLITCDQGEEHARRRLGWWRHRYPATDARLVQRKVVTVHGEWSVAADQHDEPIEDQSCQ